VNRAENRESFHGKDFHGYTTPSDGCVRFQAFHQATAAFEADPHLVLGQVRQTTWTFTPGFVLLALFAIICFVVVFKSGSKAGIKTHLVSHGAAA
jgi:hypothetical protein